MRKSSDSETAGTLWRSWIGLEMQLQHGYLRMQKGSFGKQRLRDVLTAMLKTDSCSARF